jgi:hypothetical protein
MKRGLGFVGAASSRDELFGNRFATIFATPSRRVFVARKTDRSAPGSNDQGF